MKNFMFGLIFTVTSCYLVSGLVANTWGWLAVNDIGEHPSTESILLVQNLSTASSFLSVLTVMLVGGKNA